MINYVERQRKEFDDPRLTIYRVKYSKLNVVIISCKKIWFWLKLVIAFSVFIITDRKIMFIPYVKGRCINYYNVAEHNWF